MAQPGPLVHPAQGLLAQHALDHPGAPDLVSEAACCLLCPLGTQPIARELLGLHYSGGAGAGTGLGLSSLDIVP